MTFMDRVSDRVVQEITSRLVSAGVEKVVLFGSRARGASGEDSDIDILVVTTDDFIPRNYDQKSEVYLRVANRIKDIRRKYPVDIIVHTRPMHKRFLSMNSVFCGDILREGRVLYEKDHAGLARCRSG
ncbi:nucleotidyltransferase domain-containing protein [Kiritimatiella glycovorans]|uniref:nucleotidyltransferase domain-containing protein n=1 Tax=Kiritimatiella glycovorans TaxID=1307763 RepID=UPI0009E3DCFE|nr:nucleotidyltransferase domain-containing protein [Kiritimatiella glycovorans]